MIGNSLDFLDIWNNRILESKASGISVYCAMSFGDTFLSEQKTKILISILIMNRDEIGQGFFYI